MATSPMKNCPQCGKELLSDARFCHHCGHDLQGVAEKESAADDASATPAERIQKMRSGDHPESKLWSGRYSPKGMIHGWILAGLVTIVAIVLAAINVVNGIWLLVLAGVVALVWIGLLGVLAVRVMGSRYELTDQRLIHHRGILNRVSNRIEVIDIDDVTYAQTILERLVGVGRITIISSDRSDPECRLAGIDQVEQVATLIDDARRRERVRRGLYVESV